MDQGLLELDAPLPIEWLPDELNEYRARYRSGFPMITLESGPPPGYERAADPRREITLRHALDMTSGLYPTDNEYGPTRGSGYTYSVGWDAARHAYDRGLVRQPGAVWDYENFDTLLAVFALRSVLPDLEANLDYHQDAYTMAGARGNYAVVIPSYDLVIVRRGLDRSGMSVWDMVAEVLKAFPEREGGSKPENTCGGVG